MLGGCGLQGVVGGAPALHVAGAAVHAGGHAQRGRLAAAGVAPQVKAPALQAGRAQQRPGEGAGHGEHEAAIARAQAANALSPGGGILAHAKGVLHLAVALEHDALGIVANGFVGQHVGGAALGGMPAGAVGATGELFGVAGLDVFGQAVAARGRGGDAQAQVQQRGAVFAAVAREHARGHGPLLGAA